MFGGIGAFMAVITAVYWFGSYEDAGTALLVGSMLLALFSGGWLWLHTRGLTDDGDADAEDPGPWFPHASIWPFWMGVAAFLVVNGLIVGSWFLVPGAIVLAIGVAGYAAQSRSRSPG